MIHQLNVDVLRRLDHVNRREVARGLPQPGRYRFHLWDQRTTVPVEVPLTTQNNLSEMTLEIIVWMRVACILTAASPATAVYASVYGSVFRGGMACSCATSASSRTLAWMCRMHSAASRQYSPSLPYEQEQLIRKEGL